MIQNEIWSESLENYDCALDSFFSSSAGSLLFSGSLIFDKKTIDGNCQKVPALLFTITDQTQLWHKVFRQFINVISPNQPEQEIKNAKYLYHLINVNIFRFYDTIWTKNMKHLLSKYLCIFLELTMVPRHCTTVAIMCRKDELSSTMS